MGGVLRSLRRTSKAANPRRIRPQHSGLSTLKAKRAPILTIGARVVWPNGAFCFRRHRRCGARRHHHHLAGMIGVREAPRWCGPSDEIRWADGSVGCAPLVGIRRADGSVECGPLAGIRQADGSVACGPSAEIRRTDESVACGLSAENRRTDGSVACGLSVWSLRRSRQAARCSYGPCWGDQGRQDAPCCQLPGDRKSHLGGPCSYVRC